MADPVVLSGSSLNTFLRCPAQWEILYLDRRRQRPTLKQALGIAAHQAAETNLRQKITTDTDLPVEEVVEAFAHSFKVESAPAAEDPEKGETKGSMLDSGVLAVQKWHEVVAPISHPKLVEYEIQFRLNGIPISGTIDEVDKDGTIVDHKFVGRRPQNGADYVLNMSGYAIGFRQAHPGEMETGIRLDYIVRNKVPVYVPITSGPLPDQAIVNYARVVEDVHSTIMAGNFPPNGLLSNACTWCGVKSYCKAYKE